MPTASQPSDLEVRFGHILQPIRDLTKNWDVDIASYLEEYLDDLESVVVTFNSGETTMNFVEAALLIQGSACVYSKKVEYLYALACQVLDMIVRKKKQQKSSSVDAEGNDDDADFPDEDREEFLLLDDTKVSKTGKLQAHDDPDKDHCQVQPQTPMNLVASEDGEKGAAEMNNHKGELLGNMSDFQMNCSNYQPRGGVFLDSSLHSLLHSRLRILASSTPFPNREQRQLEHSDDGTSFPMDAPPAPPPLTDISMDDGGDAGFEPLEGAPEGDQPQEEELPRRSERKTVQFAAVQTPKPVVDPWTLLDPYAGGKLAEKKLKRGQTYVAPDGAPQKGRRKRKSRAAEKKPAPLEPISEFIQTRVFSNRLKFPKNPALVPSYPEFDEMFWKEHKRREEVKRRLAKQAKERGVVTEPTEEAAEEEEENNWPAAAHDGDDLLDADEAEEFDPMEDNGLLPIEACGGEFINSLGSSASTYEDVLRQHVENYLTQATKYGKVSELTKRVAEWEEKIMPKLQEEEQRETFDIHAYGTRVMEGMQRNQWIPFRSVVTGRPTFQICRLFLATLQLANNCNLELSCKGKLKEAMDKMEMRLMSSKRHYEELADYQAPSLANH